MTKVTLKVVNPISLDPEGKKAFDMDSYSFVRYKNACMPEELSTRYTWLKRHSYDYVESILVEASIEDILRQIKEVEAKA